MELFLGLNKGDLMKALVYARESSKNLAKEFPHMDFSGQIARYDSALEVLESLPEK